MYYKLFFLLVFLFFSGCSFVSDDNTKNIARYGESFLSKEEFLSLTEGVKINDSISMVNSIINDWAIKKILIERAELNLNETKLQKIKLVMQEVLEDIYIPDKEKQIIIAKLIDFKKAIISKGLELNIELEAA